MRCLLGRADENQVQSVQMPGLSATDLTLSKLLALDEDYCDFASLFPVVRDEVLGLTCR